MILRRLARLHPQAQVDQLLDPAWRRLAGSLALTEGATLEIGCGSGWISVHASAGHPELDCVAIDWDAARLARAARNGGRRLNCTFREMHPAELRYPAATFDKAIAAQSLREWGDYEAAMAELHRVLKPGGQALICDAEPTSALSSEWLQRTGPWPPEPLIRALLERLSAGEPTWEAAQAAAARLPWRSVGRDRLGIFRRLILVK